MKPSLHGRMLQSLAFVITLLSAISIQASDLDVQILNANYSAFVSVSSNSITTSRVTVSPMPTSDSAIVYDSDGFHRAQARASSYLFGLDVNTQAYGFLDYLFARAAATNQIQFVPLEDRTQSIAIELIPGGNAMFTEGAVTLLDLSSQQVVWSQSWYYWINTPNISKTNWFYFDTEFLASHQYELSMYTAMNAGHDSESIKMQVIGLAAIPEPSAIAIFSVTCATLLVGRKRRLS